jgi:hypothetical protein
VSSHSQPPIRPRGCSARANRTRTPILRLRELDEAAATILSLRQADKARHSRAWELGKPFEIDVEWPANADEPDWRAIAPNLLKLLTEGPWTPRADEEATEARSAAEIRRRLEEQLRWVEPRSPSALLQIPEHLRPEGARRQEARRSVIS